ncbi:MULTISPECIES: hypothetical protein [Bradyrhizobium]|uniref:hypothetical protein n=1 Tax=Bradyrhizobium TaxID=374 RepID=UPI001FD7454D|nr:hypothetical protein [Bradyrhizobium vignae]
MLAAEGSLLTQRGNHNPFHSSFSTPIFSVDRPMLRNLPLGVPGVQSWPGRSKMSTAMKGRLIGLVVIDW